MSGAGVIAIGGGVGGARLAHGLAMSDRCSLTAIVNTADDFELLGLHISPDIDTTIYTLAGIGDHQRGWGIEGESWNFMEQLARLGGPGWFMLGDRDLANHVLRTHRLRMGDSLTAITVGTVRRLGIAANILPMSDAPVRTIVLTDAGELEFQDYFVARQCKDRVLGFRFEGAQQARPTAEVVAAFESPELGAIVFGPSNPHVSIAPVLAIRDVADRIHGSHAPVIAVSPIIAGNVVKGPAAKMLAELGHDVSALGVARHYEGLAQGFVIDERDTGLAPAIEKLGMDVLRTNIVMTTVDDRLRLAEECLAFAGRISR